MPLPTKNVTLLFNNCYCKLIVNNIQVKSYQRQFSKILACKRGGCRFFSTEPVVKANSKPYIKYDELLQQRRSEAKRSIIVQVHKEALCYDVYDYCSKFGEIKNIFHYTTRVIESGHKDAKDLILVEFKKLEQVNAALAASTHANHQRIMPACSSMLWFRNNEKSEKQTKNNKKIHIERNCCEIFSNMEIKKKISEAESVSDQMMILYNLTKLNDVGTRLRFCTAYQIEICFKSLFPNLAILPFGSSVNSFGKQGCDLDLNLILDQKEEEKIISKLVYHTKHFSFQEKSCVRQLMEAIGDCIKIFLPGVCHVRKILEARVPIIKFDHLLCGLECDLAATNIAAHYMSELLYIYGEIDWRVRPLTFAVRKWADSIGLTRKSPGPWVTNFQLTLMVLFFLQQKKILPSLDSLKLKADKSDVRITNDRSECTFLRDITKLPDNNNKDSLEELLEGFFLYYSNFDFRTKSISLNMGKPITKPENYPLHICNPLEKHLNVSRNINVDHLHSLMTAMREATWVMETSKQNHSNVWGLNKLFSKENKH